VKKLNKIIYNVFRSFSVPLFSFSISLIGVKFFGKIDWGNFIYHFTWVLFLAFICTLGNKDYLLRLYSNSPSKISEYFTKNITSRAIVLLLVIILFFVFPLNIATASFLLLLSLFIYQSFESLIIYSQNFLLQLVVEVIGFLIIIVTFILYPDFNLIELLYIFCLSNFIKIIIIGFYLKDYFSIIHISFSLDEIKLLIPFFLIVFSGWMASKIDLYIVNIILSNKQIAEYQLGITSFLVLQSVSYVVIAPFSKHFYRLNKSAVLKIKKNLALISTPIVTLGTIIIYLILESIAKINLPNLFYLLGGLASIPTYYFIVDILMFYRFNKEKTLMKINFIGALLSLVLTYLLIQNYGIIGAMTSVLITQCFFLVIYKLKNENITP